MIGVKENDPAGSRGCWDFLKRPQDMLEPPDFGPNIDVFVHVHNWLIG